MRPPMGMRVDCDFRHGLIEPAIARDDGGPVLTLVHGLDRVTIALSESSVHALGLAVMADMGDAGC